MTLIGSYLDDACRVVEVTMEATRQGSYLVVKDRWRSPLVREGATVELEFGAPGNARTWAECEVLTRGGHLAVSADALLCGRVVEGVGEEALEQSLSRDRTLERFLHVPAPGFADSG